MRALLLVSLICIYSFILFLFPGAALLGGVGVFVDCMIRKCGTAYVVYTMFAVMLCPPIFAPIYVTDRVTQDRKTILF